MAGQPGWGLNTIADTPDGPEGWNEDQRRPPSSPRETGCEDLPGGIRGAARAPPRMPCRVNGLYWADSKVKGKEEAQQHKCMATVFCPLRGGFGLLRAVKDWELFLPAHAAYQNCHEIIHSCKQLFTVVVM